MWNGNIVRVGRCKPVKQTLLFVAVVSVMQVRYFHLPAPPTTHPFPPSCVCSGSGCDGGVKEEPKSLSNHMGAYSEPPNVHTCCNKELSERAKKV